MQFSIIGIERAAEEMKEVFNYVANISGSAEAVDGSFAFTDKKFTMEANKMKCLKDGLHFCQVENIRSILQDYLKELPHDWNGKVAQRAALLIWLGIHIEISTEQLNWAADFVLSHIYEVVKNDDKPKMKMFFEKLPPLDYLDFWMKNTLGYPSCNIPGRALRSRCVFKETWSVFSKYHKFMTTSVKSKRVRTDFDGKKALEIYKWNRIGEQVNKKTLDIKAKLSELVGEIKNFVESNANKRFNALAKSMKTMANFGRKKSIEDVIYINGTLQEFKRKLKSYSNSINWKLGRILKEAYLKAGLEVLDKAAKQRQW